ncbi:hypothetical protein [Streptomyces sp. NPDC046985]|uniref:hypothetical protein n=1 Tax=Streptomyces sp. NPDC046985 TaxID=3155377 RepID=UPI0033E26051
MWRKSRPPGVRTTLLSKHALASGDVGHSPATQENSGILIPSSPQELRHKLDVLRGHCEAVGRDYDDIRKTFVYTGEAATDEDHDALLRDLEGYAGLGVATVILGPRVGDPAGWIDRFASRAVRSLAELA